MTDNEIIKALEQCSDCNAELRNSCNGCLLLNYFPYCTENGIDLGVDLINRLQEENNKLEIKISAVEYDLSLLRQEREVVKAEAYKEFAEKAVEQVEKARQKYQRLCKEQGEEMEEHMHIHFNGITKIINNLLKEMVGEDK